MSVTADALAVTTVDPVVGGYFEGFNAEQYDEVGALFGDRGLLRPPFEEDIVGHKAIGDYLRAEATGMRAVPLEVEVTSLAEGSRQTVVKGRVKTPLFSVNVRWTFVLTAADQIQSAEIKLLASLQELMSFNRS